MKAEMTKGRAPSRIGRVRLHARAWREVVQRHQLLLLVICLAIVPILLPFTSLAILILVFGLFAAAFNVLYGYAGNPVAWARSAFRHRCLQLRGYWSSASG